jgi:hypothetical protein
MKAVVFHRVGDICRDNVPEPTIEQPTDAIVRVCDLKWRVGPDERRVPAVVASDGAAGSPDLRRAGMITFHYSSSEGSPR